MQKGKKIYLEKYISIMKRSSKKMKLSTNAKKEASEHNSEQEKREDNELEEYSQTSKIYLPPENFAEILASEEISIWNLAERLSLTNNLFNKLARPWLDEYDEHRVAPIEFHKYAGHELQLLFGGRHPNFTGQLARKSTRPMTPKRELPIAEVPPPANILGFKAITIDRCLEGRVLNFMRAIRQKLVPEETALRIDHHYCARDEEEGKTIFKQIEERSQLIDILTGRVGACRLFNNGDMFGRFPDFLHGVQCLQLYKEPAMDQMVQWLHTPMDSGQPRLVFACWKHVGHFAAFVDQCKELFLSATRGPPVSFIFHFDKIADELEHFRVQNETTGEQLSLGWLHEERDKFLVLRRSALGDDESWRQLIEKERHFGFRDFSSYAANEDAATTMINLKLAL